MLEQELKEIWKNSSQKEKIKFETSRLLIDLKSKMDHIEKAIHRRDRTEIAASILGYYFLDISLIQFHSQ